MVTESRKVNYLQASIMKHLPNFKYCMEGNFGGGNVGEFGESSVIRQTKPIQISTYH